MIGLILHKDEHKRIPSINKKNGNESKFNEKESTTPSSKATDNEKSAETLFATDSVTSERLNLSLGVEHLPSKKRGTPKKDSLTSEMSNESPVVEQLTSTNEKIVTEPTSEMINRQSDVEQPPPKKRGRPKKHSVTSEMTNRSPLTSFNEKSTESLTVTASTSEMINRQTVVGGQSKYPEIPNSLPICEKSTESLIATASVTPEMSKILTGLERLPSKSQERPKKAPVRPEKLSQSPILEQLPSENDKSAETSELEQLLLSVSGKSIFQFVKIRFFCNLIYTLHILIHSQI